jgi:hypothetical protein
VAGKGVDYWADAIADLAVFNKAYAQVERKPGDEEVLRRCARVAGKQVKFYTWVTKAFSREARQPFQAADREVGRLAKDATAEVGQLREAVDRYKEEVQKLLREVAPENFRYGRFRVVNEDHLSDELCRRALHGVDFLTALFKKRGVDAAVLEGAISRIVLVYTMDGTLGSFHVRTRELTLAVDQLETTEGRFTDTTAGEVVVHEIGHYIHMNYIKGDAAKAWDAPWEGVVDLADPRNRYRSEREKRDRDTRLDELGIPTEYGRTNNREDFAETFLLFMVSPERLSETAKYRMQRALSLSGLYGKAVMRLAERVVARYGGQAPR